MKAKCKELEEKKSASEEVDKPKENAGNQFGGHKGNNQQKRLE